MGLVSQLLSKWQLNLKLFLYIALQWSPYEVSQWLEAVGLPMYCHAFVEHDISGAELMSLEKSDFKDVGVSKVSTYYITSLIRIVSGVCLRQIEHL